MVSHGQTRPLNQKLLRGGLNRSVSASVNQWVSGSEVQKVGRVEGGKLSSSKRKLKASTPGVQTIFIESHNIQHFTAFSDDSVQSKKPSGGPKGLIGPPCHGANGGLT